MSDQPSPESERPASEIVEELRMLGQNIKDALSTAWQSDERKKVSQEIETGLAELGTQLSQAAKDFADSPTGQTLKADVEDFNQRLRSGEVESKVRNEVLGVLRTVNLEFRKATQRSSQAEAANPQDETAHDV
ncbi:MAG: hypothetical protein JW726_16205 [Anaerolineales bacterium]|nr:hypothetical protein [Anaerolineales bacterium]